MAASIMDLESEALWAVAGSSGATALASSIAVVTWLLCAVNIKMRGPAQWKPTNWHPKWTSPMDLRLVPPWARIIAENARRHSSQATFKVYRLIQEHKPLDPVLTIIDPDTKEEHPLCAWNPDGSIIEPPAAPAA